MKVNNIIKTLVLLGIALFSIQCKGVRRQFHYFMDMGYSPSIDAQQQDSYSNRNGDMLPPENTIPHKFANSLYAKTFDGNYVIDESTLKTSVNIDGKNYAGSLESITEASRKISSPIKSSPESAARGKERFEIYCAPCHGVGGKGDGTIAAKWDLIPAIAGKDKTTGGSARANGWSEEMIFMVQTVGFQAMGSYASQVPEADRWAIAKHIKSLQKNAN